MLLFLYFGLGYLLKIRLVYEIAAHLYPIIGYIFLFGIVIHLIIWMLGGKQYVRINISPSNALIWSDDIGVL